MFQSTSLGSWSLKVHSLPHSEANGRRKLVPSPGFVN
jgi:hypothetical protein